MENASRRPTLSKERLNGLQNCIKYDAPISLAAKQAWMNFKVRGEALYRPENGGSYTVFNARPLAPDIMAYCVNDVKLLPTLRACYWARLGEQWKEKVRIETTARVLDSQSPAYQPQGMHKTLGPWRYE